MSNFRIFRNPFNGKILLPVIRQRDIGATGRSCRGHDPVQLPDNAGVGVHGYIGADVADVPEIPGHISKSERTSMVLLVVQQELQAFCIVFLSLAGLTFVIDAFTNLEEFVTHAEETGGLAVVLGRYYGYRLISFFDATSPIISLASGMFALSWLERHNELTALLAAGITRWRIARPAILFTAAVSLVAVTNREFILPKIRTAISRNAQDLSGKTEKPFGPVMTMKLKFCFGAAPIRRQLAGSSLQASSCHRY